MVLAPTWRQVEYAALPQGAVLDRAGHAAVADGNSIYVIGGRKGRSFFGDVLRFDVQSCAWERIDAQGAEGFEKRGNHTATLIGRDIWVLGGSNNDAIFSDVCVFNIDSRRWRFPTLRGSNQAQLCRSAHGADVHPLLPNSIVIMGGYGGISSTYVWMNDVLVLHTDTLVLEQLAVQGERPSPRGYHTLTTLGPHCVVIGGRTEEGRIQGRQMVAVFDPATCTWHYPKHTDGLAPQARSSHRAAALPDRIVVHGGAAGENDPNRLADVATLHVASLSRLQWSNCDQPSPSARQPQGRAAHSVSLVGSTLYLLCGYAGLRPGSAKYIGDCWALDLPLRSPRGAPQVQAALDVGSAVPFTTKPSTKAQQQQQQQQVGGRGAWATAVAQVQLGKAAAQGARDRGERDTRGAPAAAAGRARDPAPESPLASPHQGPGAAGPLGKRDAPEAEEGRRGGAGRTGPAGKRQAIEIPDSPPAAAAPPQQQQQQQQQRQGDAVATPSPRAVQSCQGGAGGQGAAGSGGGMPRCSGCATYISALEAELQQARSRMHQQAHYTNYQFLESEMAHLRRERESLTGRLQEAQRTGEDQQSSIAELQQQLAEARKELAQCRAALTDREQAAAAAANLHAHVASELATMRQRGEALQGALRVAEARLQDQTRDLEAKLDEKSRDLESERRTRSELQGMVSSLTKSVEQLQGRLQSAEETLISERRSFGEQADRSKAVERERESALEAARAELRACQAKHAAAETSAQQSRSELIEAQVRLRELQEANGKADAEVRALQGELSGARQQLHEHQESARAAEDWFRRVDALMRDGAALLLPRPVPGSGTSGGGAGPPGVGTTAWQPP